MSPDAMQTECAGHRDLARQRSVACEYCGRHIDAPGDVAVLNRLWSERALGVAPDTGEPAQIVDAFESLADLGFGRVTVSPVEPTDFDPIAQARATGRSSDPA